MPGPSAPNAFVARLLHHVEVREHSVVCRMIGNDGEKSLTWRDLGQSAGRFIAACRQRDLRPGAEILIFLRHRPELYGAFFGAMLGGYVPSFMPCTSPKQDPALYWSSHRILLQRLRPKAIVADAATFAEMSAAGLSLQGIACLLVDELGEEAIAPPSPADGDAIALLQHSSGTTGLKKGVALSFDAIVAQLERYAEALRVSSSDVIVSWLPLYHDMGLVACCLLPAWLGLPVVHIDPFAWLARPEMLFDCLAANGGTLVWLPNFAFDHLALVVGRQAAKYDLSGVRAFINCSEPCKAASFDRFARVFAEAGVHAHQLHCCYALAEAVFAVSQTPLQTPVRRIRVDPLSLERGATPRLVGPDEPGTELLESGTPLPGVSIEVCDEARRPLAAPMVGEIALKGPFLFSGYNKAPERTRENLVDGTFFTRDLGFVLDRHLYVLGRADDLIIVAGRNLYAHEIEAAVGAIDGLKPGRSAAVPLFDERLGTAALVVIAERRRNSMRGDGPLKSDIMRVVHSVFGVTPRQVHIVEEGWLIKTTSGKISRTENLARLAAAASRRCGDD